ncbi:MAG: C25 family cysteine peptidase [Pseudomonadota bacterium]
MSVLASVVSALTLVAPTTPPPTMELPAQALEQIHQLELEKASRTQAQRKMSSHLVHEAKRQRGQSLGLGLETLRGGVTLDTRGQVTVDLDAEITPELLAAVQREGGQVLGSYPQFRSARVKLPLQSVELIADLVEVVGVHEALPPMLNKDNTSEGDAAHRADLARAGWSVNGSGVAVGVLSDSVDYLSTVQTSGDLPATVTVLSGQSGVPGSGEGTAMLEIVYDLAPGASLYFATAFNGDASFAQNILDLRAAGCDIIIDDVSYFAEPVFQDGIIAQAVDQVVADGALYFSSAGNSGNLNDGESGVWEGDFVPFVLGDGTITHDFGGGSNGDVLTVLPSSVVTLQWSDPWGASANDYDIYLINRNTGAVRSSSTGTQDGNDNPYEQLARTSQWRAGDYLVIVKYSGADRFLHLSTHRGRLGVGTSGQTSGHSSAAGAFSVAAVDAAEADPSTGAFFDASPAPPVEYFSSDGLRRIFFDAAGNALTPGNFSSTGGVVRQKPDLAAADGVACATTGFDPFYGTSAAAPHAGAVAALLWSLFPTASNEEIRARLLASAIDIEAPGIDRDSGVGIVDAYSALLTEVELISFDARQVGPRVALTWRTGREVDNLGFHVYREDATGLVQLTPWLVAGSALWSSAGPAFATGRGYRWWDEPDSTNAHVRYWLEDIALDGQRTWHGPVALSAGDNDEELGEDSATLGEVDQRSRQAQARQARATSVRGALRDSGRSHRGSSGKGRTQVHARGPNHQGDDDLLLSPWPGASQPSVRIVTESAGWYEVSGAQLLAAGLDPTVDPRRLQLFTEGQQQAIEIRNLVGGHLQPSSRIGFYARALDTPWAGQRTSFLVEGSDPGLRVRDPRGSGNGGRQASSVPFTVKQSDKQIYFSALLNGDADNFFGAPVTASGVDQVIALPAVDPAFTGTAHLQVVVQGVTEQAHRIPLLLNEQALGEIVFAGRALATYEVELPQSWLLDGDNLLHLSSSAGDSDISLVASIRVDYQRLLRADSSELTFFVDGARQARLAGFGAASVRVLDLDDDGAIQELTVTTVGGSSGELLARVPDNQQHQIYAFAASAVRAPVSVLPGQPSSWNALDPGADMVVIAHASLLDAMQPLVDLREWQGLSVALIDVQDLYDEFNFGHKSPQAIRDFLAHATRTWQIPPRFALMVGDASFDPRDHLGFGDRDLLPTKLVDTRQLETASDTWFVDLDGSGIPALAIGRLPARNATEATLLVDKLLQHASTAGADWARQALLVADVDPRHDFAAGAARVATELNAGFDVQQLVLDPADPVPVRGQLLSALNQGAGLVDYLGHGSVEIWSRTSLFTSQDARALSNGERQPVLLTMTCFNGFFHDLYTESLGEALLRAPDGGAVAVWASSGLTEPVAQQVVNRELAALLATQPEMTLGEAVMLSTSLVGDPDVRHTFNLLGDPSMRVVE